MEMGSYCTHFFLLLALICLLSAPSTVSSQHQRKLYVIYMGSQIPTGYTSEQYYDKLMGDAIGSKYSKNPSEYLLRTYSRSFYGCAANLTNAEAHQIQGVAGIVSVFPNKQLKLHTTRSWDFMGFPINVERTPIEKDVIIGVIDSGIWPESASFNDAGLTPIPTKFKGICQKAPNFSCNKKIIGARFYRGNDDLPINESPTPRDFSGHGTHTASTVAGRLVKNASFFGYGSGIARGGVPGARIAVYKACWSDGCYTIDIMSAFDDAIADGVDIISMSIGSEFASDYFMDVGAIGAFHASRRGILVSMSAGNDGPTLGTVTNVAPWLMSVAASTIDRKFVTGVQLGNGKSYQGRDVINPFDMRGKKLPVVLGVNARNASALNDTSLFSIGICESLNRTLVEGKIVMCDYGRGGITGSLAAGAAGTIERDTINDDSTFGSSFLDPLPSAIVSMNDGDDIITYIKNSLSASYQPVATIMKSTTVNNTMAPYVSSFSSRGPNLITPGILKPDLSAPGVDILAAYSPIVTPSELLCDTRHVQYNFVSGTSMACPHASAAAAYVKSFHPEWSPAALRSALMTTAFPLTQGINKDGELAYGAGHINPLAAVNPGLIYDANEVDYINLLCVQGYDIVQLLIITGDVLTTCQTNTPGSVGDLNYPSMTVSADSTRFNQVFQRRVKNVGNPSSVYKVKVTTPVGVSVVVVPDTLEFKQLGEEASFSVKVEGNVKSDHLISASIEWYDGVHTVRSPIVAFSFFS